MSFDRRSFLKNLASLGAASAAGAAACGLFKETAEAGKAPIRPPGALPEEEFLSTCIRCMRCSDACPNHAIQATPPEAGSSSAGTPFIKAREQTCMLCSRVATDYLRCTQVCPSGALQPIRKTLDEIQTHVRMGVAKIDLNLCYSYNNYTCGTCYHACPMGAIRIGMWERPVVNEDACIGCGLCERACIRYPQAIRIEATDRSGHAIADSSTESETARRAFESVWDKAGLEEGTP